MKIAVPDLISNSYFPVVAAVELGCFKEEGIDAEIELVFPVDKAYEHLKAGKVDFVGGSAHSAVAAFPDWDGVKLLCAQAQGMYWFLIMHADFQAARGDIGAVKGRKIGAAPWVELGLRGLLKEARYRHSARPRGDRAGARSAGSGQCQFRLECSEGAGGAQNRRLLGKWHGRGSSGEPRSRHCGAGCPARRRPRSCFNYTMASLATTDRLIDRHPEIAEGAIRAVVKAQAALRRDTGFATKVANKVFPASEAALIEKLIRRDLPYYDASISKEFVAGMSQFSLDMGITKRGLEYGDVVAEQFRHLWAT